MKLSLLTFVTSLAIASVAAWYSIIGLTAIFSAAVIPIIIMGIVLEIGKLVAASWVYTYWKETAKLLRAYLVSAVVILMLITSMGIYGFLSKSHIDAGVGTNQTYVKVERLDSRIQSEQRVIDRAEKQLRTLDDALERYIELGAVSKGLKKREEQEPERKLLQSTITKSQNKIDIYLDEKSVYELEIKNFEVEVGPLKYIAALIYGDDAKSMLDETVRYVILLLIFVFDPLAVLLLIAANQSYRKEKPVEKEKPLSVNVGKTVRTATVDKGVKKVTKERDGVKIHFYEEDDGKG
tara:strand:- start:231 stop:1112 length:882 start_codon:yes stop_codon:yes gene_type:complete